MSPPRNQSFRNAGSREATPMFVPKSHTHKGSERRFNGFQGNGSLQQKGSDDSLDGLLEKGSAKVILPRRASPSLTHARASSMLPTTRVKKKGAFSDFDDGRHGSCSFSKQGPVPRADTAQRANPGNHSQLGLSKANRECCWALLNPFLMSVPGQQNQST